MYVVGNEEPYIRVCSVDDITQSLVREETVLSYLRQIPRYSVSYGDNVYNNIVVIDREIYYINYSHRNLHKITLIQEDNSSNDRDERDNNNGDNIDNDRDDRDDSNEKRGDNDSNNDNDRDEGMRYRMEVRDMNIGLMDITRMGERYVVGVSADGEVVNVSTGQRASLPSRKEERFLHIRSAGSMIIVCSYESRVSECVTRYYLLTDTLRYKSGRSVTIRGSSSNYVNSIVMYRYTARRVSVMVGIYRQSYISVFVYSRRLLLACIECSKLTFGARVNSGYYIGDSQLCVYSSDLLPCLLKISF